MIATANSLLPGAVTLEPPTQELNATTCSYSVSSGLKPGLIIFQYSPYNNGQSLCKTLSGAGVADSSCAVIQKGSQWYVVVTSLTTPAQTLLATILTTFG